MRRIIIWNIAFCIAAPALAQWIGTGPYGGAADVVRVDPQKPGTILAATRNGLLYRSENGGESWQNLFFPGQFRGALHTLEIHPRQSGTWFVGLESETVTVSGLYRTDDGGTTWVQLPEFKGKAVWSIEIWDANPDVMGVGTSDGAYLTQNRGESWKPITPDGNRDLRPVVSLAIDPGDSNVIYAGTTHLPWRTLNGGKSWESVHSGMLDDSDVFSIRVHPKTRQTIYASACSGVYRSDNGGKLWQRLATPRGAFRAYLVTMHPLQPNVVFAGTSAGLFRAVDGGNVWKKVSNHRVHSISFDPVQQERIYFASSTGGLLRSSDTGSTLQTINRGFSNSNLTALTVSGDTLYASSVYEPESGGIFRTQVTSADWQRVLPGGVAQAENMLALVAAPSKPGLVFATTHRGLAISADGGQTWTARPVPGKGRTVTGLAILPGAPESLFAGTDTGLFQSNDHGTTWRPIAIGSSPSSRIQMIQSSGTSVIAIVSDGKAYVNYDRENWRQCGDSPGGQYYGLAVDPGDTSSVLAAMSEGLFQSVDGCATWQPVRGGLQRSTVEHVLFHPKRKGEAYASQFGRVYRTVDAGRSWTPLADEGRNQAFPARLLISDSTPDRLFALFPRRGVWFISLGHAESSPGTLQPVIAQPISTSQP